MAEFPFRRLAAMLAGRSPAEAYEVADLSIGEPRHRPPALLAEAVAAHAHLWNRYPPLTGTPAFRAAAASWLTRRFTLPPGGLDPERHVLPLAGTKEGLFLLAQAVVPDAKAGERPVALMPNPVYAVYAGAAAMAGAEPVLMPATAATGFLPDLDALTPELLGRTALMTLCSPANPQGVIADEAYLARAVTLARRHGFVLAVDECYSEIWDRAPPPSALSVAQADGGLEGVVVFHSLSKRSSAAGLRAGFVAGDAELLSRFARLRSYAAAVQPLPLMAAATALLEDEAHVEASRDAYRAKIDLAERRLRGRAGFYRPQGGFFLWLDVGDGERATLRLWDELAVKVLPGSFLTAAGADGEDPGRRYIRLALVDPPELLEPALDRMAHVLDHA